MAKAKWGKHKWMIWGFIIMLVIMWGGTIYLGYDSCTNPEEYTKVYPEGYWAIGVVVGWLAGIVFWMSVEVINKIKVRKP